MKPTANSEQPTANSQLPTAKLTNPNYVLVILTLVFALSFLDRIIFNVLLEPIRKEFGLSDTVMGLLSGFAFTAFYTLLTIPVSRWADWGNRRNIIAGGLVLWSAMTTLSGFVVNAVQLAFARIFVGVGESTGGAPVQSLLADYFPKEKRIRAFGIFSGGMYLGVLLGYLIGGLIGHAMGWRNAFLVAGIPGILVALLLWFTVKETRQTEPGKRLPTLPIFETLKILFAKPSFRWVLAGITAGAFVNFSLNIWEATFLRRLHHFDGRQIGETLGLVKGLSGLAGTLVSGWLVQHFAKKDDKYGMLVPAWATISGGIVLLVFLFSPSATICVAGLGLATFLLAFHIGTMWVAAQNIVTTNMRAFAAAVVTICTNFIGQTLGGFVPGAISDSMKAAHGEESLRYGLLVGVFVAMISGLIMWRGARYIAADIRQASR